MNISEVADKSGIAAKTIRYYESIGLGPAPRRAENGYREYSPDDLEILRFIHRARDLGFSIRDVGDLLDLWQDRNRASAEVKALTERHIAGVEQRIAHLQSMRQTLRDLAEKCHGDDRPDCPIIDGLSAHIAAES